MFALLLLKIIRCDTHSHTIRYTLRSYSNTFVCYIQYPLANIFLLWKPIQTLPCALCACLCLCLRVCVCVCVHGFCIRISFCRRCRSLYSFTNVGHVSARARMYMLNTEPTNEELNVCICNTAACTTSERR